MARTAFDKAAAGVEAAIDYPDGRADCGAYMPTQIEVKALGTRLGLTQTTFASNAISMPHAAATRNRDARVPMGWDEPTSSSSNEGPTQ